MCSEKQIIKKFKPSALRLAISLIAVNANIALAGPEGGSVVGGSGSISQNGNATTITQNSDRMAIDWSSYDIDIDERVQYVQPGSTSVSYNRILSSNGTTIQGQIDANGQVILVNPNGIFFTKDSVINVGGILASGLRLDPSSFMNGDYTFSSLESDEGVVINSGVIHASTGGSVNLLGKRVENDGLIQAELGSVSLAAGKEAVLHFDDNRMLGIQVSESVLQEDLGLDAGVVNSGEIDASGGRVLLSGAASRDVFSSAVNMGGNEATSVVVDEDGSFTLRSGSNVVNSGSVDVSVQNDSDAGSVIVLGENISHEGIILANTVSEAAGRIELHSGDTTSLETDSVIRAESLEGEGGKILLLGDRIGLFGDTGVSVSAAGGLGEILVGGDYRGESPVVPNASAVYFGRDANITANANRDGRAGRVILWADDSLRAFGSISAEGYGHAGGGFVETSSGYVELDLQVNAGSESGEPGQWLIDPYDIIIEDNSSERLDFDDTDGDGSFDDLIYPASNASSSDPSILSTGSLWWALSVSNEVIIQTTRVGSPASGSANGDIVFLSELNFNGAGNVSLTLDADHDIYMLSNIYDGSGGGEDIELNLYAAGDIYIGGEWADPRPESDGGVGTNFYNANLDLSREHFLASSTNFYLGYQDDASNSIINTGGDHDVRIYATGEVHIYDQIYTGGGDVIIGGQNIDHDFDSSTVVRDMLPASVESYFAPGGGSDEAIGEINTTADGGGGNITINSVQDGTTNGDVRMGSMLIYDANGGNDGGGTIEIESGNDIALYSEFNYGRTEGTSLTLIAQGDIEINDRIYDSNTGNTDDSLDLTLLAGGDISIDTSVMNSANGGINLRGGNLLAISTGSSGAFNLGHQEETAGTSNSVIETSGGNVGIYVGGAVNLYDDVVTDGGDLTAGGLVDHDLDDGDSTPQIEISPSGFNTYFDFDDNDGAGPDLLQTTSSINVSTSGDSGDIRIDSSGTVRIGGIFIGDFDIDSNTTNTSSFRVDGSSIEQLGNITYGPGAGGDDNDDQNANHTVSLDFNATNSITFSSDEVDNTGWGQDRLNIELDAGSIGTITLTSGVDIWMDGGAFNIVQAGSVEVQGAGSDGADLETEGGAITVQAGSFSLGQNASINSDGDPTDGVIDINVSSGATINGDIVGDFYLYGTAGTANSFTIGSTATWTAGNNNFARINISSDETTSTQGGIDTFSISTDLGSNATFSGGEDGDIFNLFVSTSSTLEGGVGADRLNIGSGSVSIFDDMQFSFDAGSDSDVDSVYVEDAAYDTQWTLSDNNAVTINTNTDTSNGTDPVLIGLNGVDALYGSDGGDDNFSVSGDFQGSIDGRGQTTAEGDTLQLESTIGGVFQITGDDEGTLNTNLSFDGLERLLGSDDASTGNDTFDFEFSTIPVVDEPAVIGAWAGTATDAIDARGGEEDIVNLTFDHATDDSFDVLNVNLDISSPVYNGVSNTEIVGGDGDSVSLTITGGAADDSTTTWTVDGANSGSVSNSDGGSVEFEGFGNLVGNIADDQFNVTGSIISVAGGLESDTDADSLSGRANDVFDNTYSLGEFDVNGDGSVLVLSGSVTESDTNGSETYVTRFTSIESISGGSASNSVDTIEARGVMNEWVINGDQSGSLDEAGDATDYTIQFTGFEIALGGSAQDNFEIQGGGTGLAINDAGGAADQINVTNAAANTWTLAGSGDTANQFADVAATQSISFSNIEELTGSTAADEFRVTGNFAGSIDAGDGLDVLNLGYNDSAIPEDLQFSFVGGDGNDTVTVSDLGYNTQWEVTGTDSAQINTDTDGSGDVYVTLSEVEFLNGAEADTGVGGNDLFDFVFLNGAGDGIGVFNSGEANPIDARGGQDAVGVLYTLTSADVDLSSTANINGVINAEVLSGNGAGSALRVTNAADDSTTTWNVDGDNSGSVSNSGGGSILFEDFGNLIGNIADDQFNVTGSIISVAGGLESDTDADSLSGRANDDFDNTYSLGEFDVNGDGSVLVLSGSVTESDTNGSETYVTRFTSIESISGGSASNSVDTIEARGVTNEWVINGDQSGSLDDADYAILQFFGFETAIGGSAQDNFEIQSGGTGITINDAGGSADQINVTNAAANTWTLAGSGDTANQFADVAATQSISFSNIEELTGSTAADEFRVTGNFAGSIDAGDGLDVLNLGYNDSAIQEDLQFSFVGGDGNDTVTVSDLGYNTQWEVTDTDSAQINTDTDASGDVYVTLSEVEFLNGAEADTGVGGNDLFDFVFLNGAGDGIGSFAGGIDARTGNRDAVGVLFSSLTNANVDLSVTASLNGVANAEVIAGDGASSSLTVTGVLAGTETTWDITDTYEGQVSNFDETNGINSETIIFENFGILIGNDADDVFNLASQVERVEGQGGNDTLQAPNDLNAWVLAADGSGTLDATLAFTGLEILQGGSALDNFTVQSNTLSVELIGGTGVDSEGNEILDTLTYSGSANTQWNINQDSGGALGTSAAQNIVFSGVESLTGGSGDDSFEFTDAGVISRINGGGQTTTGQDEADFSARTDASPVDITLGANGLQNIESYVGNGTSSTLRGDDSGQTWDVNSDDGFSADGSIDGNIYYTDFNVLIGGTGNDVFNINDETSTATVSGGAGADRFYVDTSIAQINGGEDSDSFYLSDLGITADLIGGEDADGLDTDSLEWAHPDIVNIFWNIIDEGDGTVGSVVAPFSHTIEFYEMEDLIGGGGADTFTLGVSPNLFNRIDGGDGQDVLDLVLLGADDYELSILQGFEVLTAAANSTLTGPDNESLWEIDGLNSGSVTVGATTTEFSGISEIFGGGGVDTFTFASGGQISGGITGGNGDGIVDVINGNDGDPGADTDRAYRLSTTPGSGTLDIEGDDSLPTSFAGIENIIGGDTSSDYILGPDGTSEWIVDGSNQGRNEDGSDNVRITFDGMDVIDGGSQQDIFDIQANVNLLMTLNGLGGADYFYLRQGVVVDSSVSLRGGPQADIFYIDNLNVEARIFGGGGSDELYLQQTNTAALWSISSPGGGQLGASILSQNIVFNNISNLYGSDGGSDTFNFASSNASIGTVYGRGGDDELRGRDTASTYALSAENNGAVSTVNGSTYVNFELIEELHGTSVDDILVATGEDNNWSISGDAQGNLASLDFSGMETLRGGGGDDAFDTSGLSYIISLFGGGQNLGDTLSYDGVTDANWNLDGGNSGTLGTSISFAEVEILAGGTGSDTVHGLDLENTWTVDGEGQGGLSNSSGALSFSEMERLAGGSVTDHFEAQNLLAVIEIQGNSSADDLSFTGGDTVSWNLTASQSGNLISANAVVFNGIETLNGGSGTDTLNGPNILNTWTISGASQGDVATTNFTGMEQLVGGSNNDTFNFGDSPTSSVASVTGGNGLGEDRLQGRMANSTYISSGDNEGVVNLVSGVQYVSFSEIESVEAQGASDFLQGQDQTNTWFINGADNVELDSTDYIAVENLTGESQVDIFDFTSGTASISGVIDGNGDSGGNDIIQARDTVNRFLIVGSGDGNLEQVNGDDTTVRYANFLDIEEFVGGNSSDTLQARNQENSWTISGANSGDVGGIDFSGIENLVGGTDKDVVTFEITGDISGLIDAGAPNYDNSGNQGVDGDELIVTAMNNGVVVAIGNRVIPNIASSNTNATQINAYNFERVIGGQDGLNGIDEANNWVASSYSGGVSIQIAQNGNGSFRTNEGWVAQLDLVDEEITSTTTRFYNFGSVHGGSSDLATNVADRIAAPSGFNITGVFEEGSGASNIEWDQVTGLLVVDIRENLNSVIGNGSMLLRATDAEGFGGSNTWTISDENSGTFNTVLDEAFELVFSGVNQLEGGGGADIFEFTESGNLLDGSINGGGGVNTISADVVDGNNNIGSTVNLVFGLNELRPIVTSPTPEIIRISSNNPPTEILTSRGGIIDILNIETLTGNSRDGVVTTLYSPDAGSYTWGLDGTNSIINNTDASEDVDFINIDQVFGGAADDRFNISVLDVEADGTLSLSAGNNYLVGGVILDLDAGEGNDVLNLSGINQAFDVSVDRGVSTAGVVLINSMEVLDLPNFEHSLYGADYQNTWDFTSQNGGSLTYNDGVGRSIEFNNVAHAMGNDDQDIFTFEQDGSISGSVNGGANDSSVPDELNVASENTQDFVFQVTSLDNQGRAIDTGVNIVDIVGIETLNANAARDNTLMATNTDNVWFVDGANDSVDLNGTSLDFSGINNLQGGSAQDAFTFDGTIVSGLVDAGSNLAGAGDSLTLENFDGLVVHVGDRVTSDLNVLGIESYTSEDNSQNMVLRGDDVANTWVLDNEGIGTLNSATFEGFDSLVGGSANDGFTFGVDGQIAGSIDGGEEPDTGAARDTLNIVNLDGAVTVSLDPTYVNSDIQVSRLEDITASDTGHWLVGPVTTNRWAISNEDEGDLNGTMTFDGFANLQGRDEVDVFEYTGTGNISGQVNGGGQPQDEQDTVDYSLVLGEVEVLVGDQDSGFVDIESYIGNGANSTLYGQVDIDNDWTVSDADTGTVSNNLETLEFSAFANLVGGDNVDDFAVENLGSISGGIQAGEGSDTLEVDLAMGRNGEITFDGGLDQAVDDTDQITITGGDPDNRFASEYSVGNGGEAQLSFTMGDLNYDITYLATEAVDNDVYTDTMLVDMNGGLATSVDLLDAYFQVNDQALISLDLVQSFVLDGDSTDQVILVDDVDFVQNIELRNIDVVDSGNGSLSAGIDLIFDRTSGLGTDSDTRLMVDASNLQLNGVNGASYLEVADDVNLTSMLSPAGPVDLLVNGSITSAVDLQTAQALTIVADDDITLSGENNLSGELRFSTDETLTLNNSTTNLASVDAGNFVLTARARVEDSGMVDVDQVFTINGAEGSVVVLDNVGNTFNQIALNSQGSVSLRDYSDSGISNVQGSAANGLDLVADQAINSSAISGRDIYLESQNALVNIGESIIAENLIRIIGNGVDVSGLLSVENSVGGQAVEINAGSGNLDLFAGINAAQNVSGDVVLEGANIFTAQNADILGRNININSDVAVSISSNVVADESISVTSGGSITMEPVIPGIVLESEMGSVTLNAQNNIQIQGVDASQLTVTANTGNIAQQGDASVSGNVSYTALNGEVSSTAGSSATVGGTAFDISSSSLQWLGDVNANLANAQIEVTGNTDIGGNLEFLSASINSSGSVTMSAGASVGSQSTVNLTSGGDLRVANLNALERVTLDVGGQVIDNDAGVINIEAPSLIAVSQTGFGIENHIDTAVAEISVVNSSGDLSVINNQELLVNALINNGNVNLRNSEGNVVLNNQAEEDYLVEFTGTPEAGGLVDAGYGVGDVNIYVADGYLSAMPQIADINRPELVGHVVHVDTADGFGVRGRRLVVYATEQLQVLRGGGLRPRWGFRTPPRLPTFSDRDLANVGVFGSLADLFIEFVGEIDPAIFTNVTNYVYEDVSIRMPRDQLLEEEEEEDEEEAWKRLEES